MAAVQGSWGDVKKDGTTAETNQLSWPRAAKRRKKKKTQLMWLLHLIMPSLGLQGMPGDACFMSSFVLLSEPTHRLKYILKGFLIALSRSQRTACIY